jgi:hypothetical protein
MIKWITFALILFVSCILGVLGEFLNSFTRERSSKGLLFTLLLFLLLFFLFLLG